VKKLFMGLAFAGSIFLARLTNIMKEPEYKIKNNSFQVGVAYKFK